MNTYSAEGKAQRALERLIQGTATIGELRAWAGEMTPSQHRKYVFLTGALLRDGLVTCRGGIYAITNFGRSVLKRLQSGEAVTVGPVEPGARVFTNESSRDAEPGNRPAAAA